MHFSCRSWFSQLCLCLLIASAALGCSDSTSIAPVSTTPPTSSQSPTTNPTRSSEATDAEKTSAAAQPTPNLVGTSGDIPLVEGREYGVQQGSYDDGEGAYTLMLIDAPVPQFSSRNLQLARLTDEQLKAGKKSFIKVENQQPVFYMTEDFRFEYIHNVVEERQNPTTGRTEPVVVRRESSFWGPFLGQVAGQVAGQAIGNLLFRPQYYVPPRYDAGGMRGYGGYGRGYDDAIATYRQRYNEPPVVERNRTVFRQNGTIGSARSPVGPASRSRPNRGDGVGNSGEARDRSSRRTRDRRDPAPVQIPRSQPAPPAPPLRPRRDLTPKDRSTGSGVSSSDLRKSTRSQRTRPRRDDAFQIPTRSNRGRSSGSFGSGRSRSSGGSFGSGRSARGGRR